MVAINVRTNVKAMIADLDRVQRQQVPFATAYALTQTAKAVERELQAEMARDFESPSPYTLRSTFSTSATKVRLSAMVGIKDKKPAGGTAPAVLLKEHFTGGERGNKPMEKAMRSIGALPDGWLVVPGAGMPLDAYGNPRRKDVAELIGALRTGLNVHKGKGKRAQTTGYFVIAVGSGSHLEPGIYKRINNRVVKPMFVFVQHARYRKRIDLPLLARRVVDRVFDAELQKSRAYALRTAR